MNKRTAWLKYVHEALRLADVVGVQPDLRVRPHSLSLAEGLEALTVDGADQDLTREQLEEEKHTLRYQNQDQG